MSIHISWTFGRVIQDDPAAYRHIHFIDMHTDICTDMCTDMQIDMRTDMRTDMCRDTAEGLLGL